MLYLLGRKRHPLPPSDQEHSALSREEKETPSRIKERPSMLFTVVFAVDCPFKVMLLIGLRNVLQYAIRWWQVRMHHGNLDA